MRAGKGRKQRHNPSFVGGHEERKRQEREKKYSPGGEGCTGLLKFRGKRNLEWGRKVETPE